MCTKKLFSLFFIIVFAALFGGCAGLLPRGSDTSRSLWDNYEDAAKSFDRIVVNQTTVKNLKRLGFDPLRTPNIKILTHLDIKKQFIVTPFDSVDALPIGVKECLTSKNSCYGLEIGIVKMESKRYGNAFLDIFNFKRSVEQKGWEFNGLIIVKNDIVVYKLAGGKPSIAANKVQVNPLGPLQSLDGSMFLNGAIK